MRISICLSVALLFLGCAKEVQVVNVPQKCSIPIPPKPAYTGNTPVDVINILKHTELLEADLKFCITNE